MKVYVHISGLIGISEQSWDVVLTELPVYVHNVGRQPSMAWVVQAYEKDSYWTLESDY